MAVIFAFFTHGGCVLAGFLAGLFSFRHKERWCGQHGVVKRCPLCEPLGSYPQAARPR
jgi:hypothetical protein